MNQTTSARTELKMCDGNDLSRMVRAGLRWLEQHYEHVNALNVFPVPDGDTGTNMMLTMRSAYREIEGIDEAHVGRVAHKVYHGALMGARGNSGVILSQLLRGFARGLEDEETFGCDCFVSGLREAVDMAYHAVQEPVEGTMLTVAREASDEASAAVATTQDIGEIMARVVARAHTAVQRTPELLQVLADAGVVDSGGMGLAYILEGMLREIRGEPVEMEVHGEAAESLHSALEPTDEEGYGYDVQYLIKGEALNVVDVRSRIESLGWSTLVVGDENLIKVHVHVHNPGEVLGYGANQGVLLDVVVENMQEQYETFVAERGGLHQQIEIAPPTIETGTIASVTVAPGDGLKQIFYSLGAGHVIEGGQTMNPSTKDLLEAINELPTDQIVLLPNNKNIFMAAEQAAAKANGKDVRVIATRSIPQGIAAQLALDPHGDIEQVTAMMVESSQMVQTGEVTRATRDVKMNGVTVQEGQIIGLREDNLVVAGNEVADVVIDLLAQMDAPESELISLYYGADTSAADAEELAQQLGELYPEMEIELRAGDQPHYFYILSVE